MPNIKQRASELLAAGWWPDETFYISIEFGLPMEEARTLTDEMARQMGDKDRKYWGVGR